MAQIKVNVNNCELKQSICMRVSQKELKYNFRNREKIISAFNSSNLLNVSCVYNKGCQNQNKLYPSDPSVSVKANSCSFSRHVWIDKNMAENKHEAIQVRGSSKYTIQFTIIMLIINSIYYRQGWNFHFYTALLQ